MQEKLVVQTKELSSKDATLSSVEQWLVKDAEKILLLQDQLNKANERIKELQSQIDAEY